MRKQTGSYMYFSNILNMFKTDNTKTVFLLTTSGNNEYKAN